MQQQRVVGDMQQQSGGYYPKQQQETQQQQQEWMNNNLEYEGKENDCISQNCEKYMNSLNPLNLIKSYGDKPQVGHTKYGYASSTIMQEVSLTSENLRTWAILDSGASSHLLLYTAPVLNKLSPDLLPCVSNHMYLQSVSWDTGRRSTSLTMCIVWYTIYGEASNNLIRLHYLLLVSVY